MSIRLRRRRRDELGAVAIIMAAMALVICMFAAYAVDIGMQVNRKHMLADTLDAAAQAGAYELPGSSANASTQALAFAKAHDPSEDGTLKPNVDFWCVVASKLTSGSYGVDTSQIPATCNPGAAPYTVDANYGTTGRKISCSEILCAIPCVEPVPNNGNPAIACNTIRVYQGRDVPFAFAPAGGIAKGGTGTLISVACKGSCGTIAPNPMDVAIVADRTGSMSTTDNNAMIAGMRKMLQAMTPSQQYVALGTIARSNAALTTPTSEPGGSCPSSPEPDDITKGAWIPIPFSNNYLTSSQTLNENSALVKGITCLTRQSDIGTPLASPMKAAARYLLGLAPNNLSSLARRDPPVTKVLIFETDGQPNETPSTRGTTSLGDAADVFSNNNDASSVSSTVGPTTSGPVASYANRTTGSGSSKRTWRDTYNTTTKQTTRSTTTTLYGGQNSCANLKQVAANAKAQGILIITIAYNLGGDIRCSDYNPTPSNSSDVDEDTTITAISPTQARKTVNGKYVLDTTYTGNATITQTYTKVTTNQFYVQRADDDVVRNTLAAAASPVAGMNSAANNDCSTIAGKTAENSDGDYFFCAASGTDMAPIFTTALSQVSKGIKLIKMP